MGFNRKVTCEIAQSRLTVWLEDNCYKLPDELQILLKDVEEHTRVACGTMVSSFRDQLEEYGDADKGEEIDNLTILAKRVRGF